MFELEIQQAVYSILSNNVDLTDLAAVYDDVQQVDDSGAGADFPYVTIGEDILNQWDTDTEDGMQGSITVHTWSRYSGRLEAKQVQGLVYNALQKQDFEQNGYNFVNIQIESSTSFLESDNLTRHGVQTFNILIQRV